MKKSKPKAVVQDAGAQQKLLNEAARADVYEALRQGEDDIAHGRTRPAEEFFKEFRRAIAYRDELTHAADASA